MLSIRKRIKSPRIPRTTNDLTPKKEKAAKNSFWKQGILPILVIAAASLAAAIFLFSTRPNRVKGVKVWSPIQAPILENHFTVRINTWKREELLEVVIDHYQTCSSVSEIVVVWCIAQGEPPSWLLERKNVILERHELNSLNERFRLLHQPSTQGILSVDDDVLRPCLALELGFAKWRENPHRIVGYDARSHTHDWKYAYLSTTTETNQYSITLPRYAFIHRNYLDSYIHEMPSEIRDFVDEHLNCEDIAMSFWVSSQTEGQVPLLVDCWAMQPLQIKLYHEDAISSASNHKEIRDQCVANFSRLLNLREKLKWEKLVHSEQKCGAVVKDPSSQGLGLMSEYVVQRRLGGVRILAQVLLQMKEKAAAAATARGLIEHTREWEERFGDNQ